jgi:hypothetical protein
MFSVRRRFDPQPTSPALVLLASAGAPFSKSAIRRARELAAGEPIAVLTILTIYGSAFGLPNPGLMPTRRERDEQFGNVQRAIRQLERQGCSVDGQVAATRSSARMIAKVARARQVRYVIMDERAESSLRGLASRGVTSTVRRRLAGRAVLELVKPET